MPTARSRRPIRSRPVWIIAAVGPEHAYLRQTGRAEYTSVSDDEALTAFHALSEQEGIIPALESAHAVAYAMCLAATLSPGQIVIINLSGRGDKDVETVQKLSPLASAKQSAPGISEEKR